MCKDHRHSSGSTGITNMCRENRDNLVQVAHEILKI